MLAHEFGVDLGRNTWVSAEEEHVHKYQDHAPSNAVYQIGVDLNKMLVEGEIAAGIGLSAQTPDLIPLIPSARAAALDYLRRSGIYQINHVIVVKDPTLAERPWLAPALYHAFKAAKEEWLRGSAENPLARELGFEDGDRFPYGIAANRRSPEALVQFAHEQHILPRVYPIEELFPLRCE